MTTYSNIRSTVWCTRIVMMFRSPRWRLTTARQLVSTCLYHKSCPNQSNRTPIHDMLDHWEGSRITTSFHQLGEVETDIRHARGSSSYRLGTNHRYVIKLHIHAMNTLQQARKTRWRKITRIEQESNLYLPITGRLFYQLNYRIFSLVITMMWLRIRQVLWSDVHQDNGEFDFLRIKRVKTRSTISLVHNTCRSIRNSCIHNEYVPRSTKDVSEKDHKTRTGVAIASSNHGSTVLSSWSISASPSSWLFDVEWYVSISKIDIESRE